MWQRLLWAAVGAGVVAAIAFGSYAVVWHPLRLARGPLDDFSATLLETSVLRGGFVLVRFRADKRRDDCDSDLRAAALRPNGVWEEIATELGTGPDGNRRLFGAVGHGLVRDLTLRLPDTFEPGAYELRLDLRLDCPSGAFGLARRIFQQPVLELPFRIIERPRASGGPRDRTRGPRPA